MTYRSLSILTLALALAACQATPPGAGVALAPKQASTAAPAAVRLAPSIVSVTPPSGEARLTVRLTVVDGATGYRLAAVPTAWQSVRVTLFSPTANTGFDATKHEVTLPSASFAVSGVGRRADATFPILRPAADYRAELFVTNSAGTVVTARLAGSAAKVLTLNAGANVLSFVLTLNGEEASANVGSSSSAASNLVETLVGYTASTHLTGFSGPHGLDFDSAGNLYVIDHNNNRIRKITPAGVASTYVTGLTGAWGIAIDRLRNLAYVTDGGNVLKVDLTTAVKSTYASGLAGPDGICVDAAGDVYVAESSGWKIKKIRFSDAGVETVVGAAGSGNADGTLATARISGPFGVAVDASGILYVADTGNDKIRKVDRVANAVTTLAGSGAAGSADGIGTAATLSTPCFIVADDAGRLVWVEEGSHKLRALTLSDNKVTTLAGSTGGLTEGLGTTAKFNDPCGVILGSDGAFYVGDFGNNRVRKVAPTYAEPVVTRGDTVTLATGLMANQPGVEYLLIKLSGPAYGSPGTPVLIKRVDRSPDGATWDSVVWNTAVNNSADGAAYVAATFAATATGQTQVAGQLDFEAYDRYDRLAGKASLPIKAMGRVGNGSGNLGFSITGLR